MINNDSIIMELDARKIVKIVLALQLVVFVVFGLDITGLNIPVLRQFIGCLYLIFVPGILLLLVIRIRVSVVETTLYAIGLSVAFLTIIGLFVNSVFPFFGIENPISVLPLMATISVIIITLCIFILFRRKPIMQQNHRPHFNWRSLLFYKVTLFLLLIPLLSVLGAYLTHFYYSNILLLVVLAMIASIPILVVFGKIPARLFPLAILSIALSLLYQQAFACGYIWGRDIHYEYYYANLVNISSYWDSTIPVRLNAMLGDVMLAPVFSHILAMDLTSVFKIVYPFLYSIIPLGLYQITHKQMGARLAFLSAFLFACFSGYRLLGFAEIKVLMATFFLSLLVLSMVNRNVSNIGRVALAIIFSFGLITSHYASSYIFMISAFLVLLLTFLVSKLRKIGLEKGSFLTSTNFVCLFIVMAFAWYMYIAGGDALWALTDTGKHFVSQITEFFSPIRGGGIDFATTQLPSFMYEILKILYFVTQFFMVVGWATVAYQKWKGTEVETRFNNEYFLYSTVFLAWLSSALAIPSITSSAYGIGVNRLYLLSLVFMAPFCMVGGIQILEAALKAFYKLKLLRPQPVTSGFFAILAIFLALLFLFDTEFVMEVHQEISGGQGHCTSLAFAQPRIKAGRCTERESVVFSTHYTPAVDVFGARWLGEYKDERKPVVVDLTLVPYSCGMVRPGQVEEAGKFGEPRDAIERAFGDRYIYLRQLNVRYGIIMTPETTAWGALDYYPSLDGNNKIYSNGGCIIYD